MSIDWDKPIETVSGLPAKVISTDFRSKVGVSVVLQIEYTSHSFTGYYTHDGKSEYGSPEIRNRKTKRAGWVNVYPGGVLSPLHETEILAKSNASKSVLATLKIEWEE